MFFGVICMQEEEKKKQSVHLLPFSKFEIILTSYISYLMALVALFTNIKKYQLFLYWNCLIWSKLFLTNIIQIERSWLLSLIHVSNGISGFGI